MQIKIRAWDSINKRMLSWEDLLSGREFRPKMREPEKYGLELMMYTGLKDKNGVEIYEGDIIRANQTIDYHEDMAIEYDFNHPVVVTLGRFDCSGYFLGDVVDELDAFVTGNIYENPELMEDE